MSDLISATFTPVDELEIMNLIAQIRAKFPFGIKLTTEHSKRLPKLDDRRIPFAEKVVAFGEQQPKIVPPYTDLAELKKDLDFVKATRSVGTELQSLFEMVTAPRMATGSDAYQAALSIYNSTKSAVKQGVPHTQVVVDEMRKLFNGQGSTAKPNEYIAKQNKFTFL